MYEPTRESRRKGGKFPRQLDLVKGGFDRFQVHAEYRGTARIVMLELCIRGEYLPAFDVRWRNENLSIETARSQQCTVEHIDAISSCHHNNLGIFRVEA